MAFLLTYMPYGQKKNPSPITMMGFNPKTKKNNTYGQNKNPSLATMMGFNPKTKKTTPQSNYPL